MNTVSRTTMSPTWLTCRRWRTRASSRFALFRLLKMMLRNTTSGSTSAATNTSPAESNEYSLAYNYVADMAYMQTMENTRKYQIRPLPTLEDDAPKYDIWFNKCGDEYVARRKQ